MTSPVALLASGGSSTVLITHGDNYTNLVVTPNVAWLMVDSNADNPQKDVSISDLNNDTGAARTGTLTLTADGYNPAVIIFNQPAN